MDILETLGGLNRWWNTGIVEPAYLEEMARDEFAQVEAALQGRRVLALVGPRRTGKSTLLYQTIDYLLKKGTDPAAILFFNGDNPLWLGEADVSISDIIKVYIDTKLHQPFIELKKRIFIFIDEIHFLADWQFHIKTIYDQNPNVKFIISGSSSIQMFLGSRESLLGRIMDIHILPFCFDQFLRFYRLLGSDPIPETFDYDAYRELLPSLSVFDDPRAYYGQLESKRLELSFFDLALNKAAQTYLVSGGYPEFFKTETIRRWQRILVEDIINKGLYRDIVSFYRVSNPMILEKLLYLIAGNNGGEYAYTGIAGDLGVDTNTASTYINYLSQAGLVTVLENYSSSTAKVIRKNKKIYVADNGIRNAILYLAEPNARDEGFLAESAAVHMARRYCEEFLFRLYFWREKQCETDMVIDKKNRLLPVEVKYRNDVQDKDLSGLRLFMEKHGLENGLVISKNTLSRKDGIYCIPFRLIRSQSG